MALNKSAVACTNLAGRIYYANNNLLQIKQELDIVSEQVAILANRLQLGIGRVDLRVDLTTLLAQALKKKSIHDESTAKRLIGQIHTLQDLLQQLNTLRSYRKEWVDQFGKGGCSPISYKPFGKHASNNARHREEFLSRTLLKSSIAIS